MTEFLRVTAAIPFMLLYGVLKVVECLIGMSARAAERVADEIGGL